MTATRFWIGLHVLLLGAIFVVGGVGWVMLAIGMAGGILAIRLRNSALLTIAFPFIISGLLYINAEAIIEVFEPNKGHIEWREGDR